VVIEDDEQDEPTETELAVEARIDDAVAGTSAAARAVIDDVHEGFGYGIPTVVLGQVGRWFWETAQSKEGQQDAVQAAQALCELYVDGDDFVRTVIATGFLEALPYASEEGRDVIELLPDPLRNELRHMEHWNPR
jgi:hypothetical protein